MGKTTTSCGQCEVRFVNQKAYLAHECSVLGRKPTEPDTSEAGQKISGLALARGAARVKLEKAGKSRKEAIAATRNVKLE